MLRVAWLVLLSSCLAYGQHDTQAQDHQAQDHHNMVNEHGDKVMGFSHEKTTHHFVLTQDGGLIEVRVNDLKDAASLDQTRTSSTLSACSLMATSTRPCWFTARTCPAPRS